MSDAQIAEIEERLTQQTARADAAAAALAQTSSQLDVARSDLAAARARVAELERLLAPPPQASDVVTVTYSDGRVKYAAPDGNKYPIAADAQRHSQVVALMKLGLGEAQAEIMLQHGDEAIRALRSS